MRSVTGHSWLVKRVAAALFSCPAAVVAATLLFPVSGSTQGGIINDSVLRTDGTPAVGSTVRVCTEAAGGLPCSPLASIFTDKALSVAKTNPFTTDSVATYNYYAAPGFYKEQICLGGSCATRIVQFGGDPENFLINTATFGELNNIRFVGSSRFPSTEAGLNAAVADVPSGGGIVVLPEGTISISGTISVGKPLILIGRGQDVSIISSSNATADVIALGSGTSKFQLQGFTIQRSVTATAGAGIRVTNTANWEGKISQVRLFKNFDGAAIVANGNGQLYVDYSFFEKNARHGLYIDMTGGGPIHVSLHHNRYFYNGHTNGSGSGLVLTGPIAVIESAVGEHAFGNKDNGFQFISTDAQVFCNGCIADSSGSSGVRAENLTEFTYTDGWSSANGVTFTGTAPDVSPVYTTFSASEADGIRMDSTVKTARIVGNVFMNNGFHGVVAFASPNVTISGNTVISNGQAGGTDKVGIWLSDSGGAPRWKNAVITGNRSYYDSARSPATQTQDYGMFVSGGDSSSFLHLADNDFTGNGTGPINDSTGGNRNYILNSGIVSRLRDNLRLDSGSLVIGDDNYNFAGGSFPTITFDSLDAIQYDRTSNLYSFYIANNPILRIASTNTTFFVGVNNNGSGLKHKRDTAGCATAATAGATCDTTITWANAFADANYSVECQGEAITSGVPADGGVHSKVAGSIQFRTVAITAAAAQFTNITCTAMHD